MLVDFLAMAPLDQFSSHHLSCEEDDDVEIEIISGAGPPKAIPTDGSSTVLSGPSTHTSTLHRLIDPKLIGQTAGTGVATSRTRSDAIGKRPSSDTSPNLDFPIAQPYSQKRPKPASSSGTVRRLIPSTSSSGPSLLPAPKITTSAVRKGSTFSTEEDVQLCHSWLAISQNPLRRGGSIGVNFWKSVLTHFKKHMKQNSSNPPYVERTIESLEKRFDSIDESVNKYVGFLGHAKNLHRGRNSTPTEIHTDAHWMYKELEKEEFTFVQSYYVLSKAPKWNTHYVGPAVGRNFTKPTPIDQSASKNSEDDSDIEIVSIKRPMGVKAAKRARLLNYTSSRATTKT